MHALLFIVHREFDDQNGILGRQADDGEHADLEIDVVEEMPEAGGAHGADHAERND